MDLFERALKRARHRSAPAQEDRPSPASVLTPELLALIFDALGRYNVVSLVNKQWHAAADAARRRVKLALYHVSLRACVNLAAVSARFVRLRELQLVHGPRSVLTFVDDYDAADAGASDDDAILDDDDRYPDIAWNTGATCRWSTTLRNVLLVHVRLPPAVDWLRRCANLHGLVLHRVRIDALSVLLAHLAPTLRELQLSVVGARVSATLHTVLSMVLRQCSELELLALDRLALLPTRLELSADTPPLPTHERLATLVLAQLGQQTRVPLHLLCLPGLRRITLHGVRLQPSQQPFSLPSVTKCRVKVSAELHSLAALRDMFPSVRSLVLYFCQRYNMDDGDFLADVMMFFEPPLAAARPLLKRVHVSAASRNSLDLLVMALDDVELAVRGGRACRLSKDKYYAAWRAKD